MFTPGLCTQPELCTPGLGARCGPGLGNGSQQESNKTNSGLMRWRAMSTARHRIKPLFVLFDSCWGSVPQTGSAARAKAWGDSGWGQSPGAEHLDDRWYMRIPMTMPRECLVIAAMMIAFWVGIFGMNPTIPRVYREVERTTSRSGSRTCFPGCSGGRGQSILLTVDQCHVGWGPGRSRAPQRNRGIRLDDADVITLLYDEPAAFELQSLSFPARAPDPVHRVPGRTLGDTVERILPIAKRTTLVHSIEDWCPQDPDLLPLGLMGSSVHNGPENLVSRHSTTRWTAPSGAEMDALEGLTGPSGPRVQSCSVYDESPSSNLKKSARWCTAGCH